MFTPQAMQPKTHERVCGPARRAALARTIRAAVIQEDIKQRKKETPQIKKRKEMERAWFAKYGRVFDPVDAAILGIEVPSFDSDKEDDRVEQQHQQQSEHAHQQDLVQHAEQQQLVVEHVESQPPHIDEPETLPIPEDNNDTNLKTNFLLFLAFFLTSVVEGTMTIGYLLANKAQYYAITTAIPHVWNKIKRSNVQDLTRLFGSLWEWRYIILRLLILHIGYHISLKSLIPGRMIMLAVPLYEIAPHLWRALRSALGWATSKVQPWFRRFRKPPPVIHYRNNPDGCLCGTCRPELWAVKPLNPRKNHYVVLEAPRISDELRAYERHRRTKCCQYKITENQRTMLEEQYREFRDKELLWEARKLFFKAQNGPEWRNYQASFTLVVDADDLDDRLAPRRMLPWLWVHHGDMFKEDPFPPSRALQRWEKRWWVPSSEQTVFYHRPTFCANLLLEPGEKKRCHCKHGNYCRMVPTVSPVRNEAGPPAETPQKRRGIPLEIRVLAAAALTAAGFDVGTKRRRLNDRNQHKEG
ncbi:hypothetical protein QBC47DRAFT_439842 [Echria macrotheca]|uniref:Uncharacterized protein n=1 Tax=Echria macrotheca TaxID=438768 RepID=A0AAJ0B169_9PEZI|nr:hypothetical protein QBC47DRAFT_439842 [Echria macrotheca]